MNKSSLATSHNAIARLNEAMKHWMSAAEAYTDPEDFRIHINACIQSLRNVTFVLQKQKKEIPNFKNWYGKWQEALKEDPIMGWCVDARNKIVKEGDLETKSVAKASLVTSYLGSPINEFTVSPFATTESIANEIADKALPDELSKSGYLCVERQWIAENLIDIELLQALAHAFTILSKLVSDISEQKGPSIIYSDSSGRKLNPADIITQETHNKLPECMRTFAKYRIIWLKLSTRELVSIKKIRTNISAEQIEEARKRYTSKEDEFKRHNKPLTSIKDSVEYFMKMARRILEVDGHHIPTIIVKDKSGKMNIFNAEFEDQDDKYLFWNNFAKEVISRQIVEVITIMEAWGANFDPDNPTRRASESPDREELLQVVGITLSGEEYCLHATFTKVNGKAALENNIIMGEATPWYLNPIKQAWGLV